jgi:hypothetical protein
VAGKTRDWQLFARAGECFVPRAVLEEIEFLCNRASEPDIERAAREFSRFYPESGWHSTLSIATHPALKRTEAQALSHKAQLSFTVAQTAYGLSRNRSDCLVVLVANDQSLMQRIRLIDAPNLCAIPLAAMMVWCRTLRRPAVVSTQMQVMRQPVTVAGGMNTVGKLPRSTASPVRVPPPAVKCLQPRPLPQRHALRLQQTFYNLLTLLLVASVVLGVWRVIEPASFERFWQQLPIVGRQQ